jgi:uncharacterized OB-fold protein
MNPMRAMIESATHGKLALQRCTACATMQYPPRELCVACLADTLEWRVSDDALGEVLANTVLHHSHEPAFGAMLPMRVGLVRLDAGPTAVCFLAEDCSAGTRVRVTARLDGEGRAVLSASAATASFAAVTKGVS